MKNTNTPAKPKTKKKSATPRKVTASKNPERTGLMRFAKNKKLLAITMLLAGAVGVYLLAQSYALIDPTYPKYEADVYERVNTARKNAGKVVLKPTQCIHDRALIWARYLANNNLLKHQDMARVMKQCQNGDTPNYGAETLFVWDVYLPTDMTPSMLANEVVKQWLNSSSHKSIMLSSTPNTIGVGVATLRHKDSNGKDMLKYFVVADYAAKCGTACGAVYMP